MASSAKATYFATPEGGHFRYVLLIRNTSAGTFDLYAFLFGAQYNVVVPPGGLQGLAPLSAPQGWQLVPSTPPYGFLSGQTSFAGTPVASGYILPGEVGSFAFESSTPPPETLPFGCCFYNENNEWGFAYDGVAQRVDCIPKSEFPPPWVRRCPNLEFPRVPLSEAAMLGTTTRTIGGEAGAPSVTVTYDKFGNLIRFSPRLPRPAAER